MTRFVIVPQVALALAETEAVITDGHRLLAPTLLRSQVLADLYDQVRSGRLSRQEAGRRLDYLRGLRLRLLGDRVLQRVAWDLAEALDWPDTLVAEYLALTKLQGDALVTDSAELAEAASRFVTVVPMSELLPRH